VEKNKSKKYNYEISARIRSAKRLAKPNRRKRPAQALIPPSHRGLSKETPGLREEGLVLSPLFSVFLS
jgi:hypothetical protein